MRSSLSDDHLKDQYQGAIALSLYSHAALQDKSYDENSCPDGNFRLQPKRRKRLTTQGFCLASEEFCVFRECFEDQ